MRESPMEISSNWGKLSLIVPAILASISGWAYLR